jgi:hypothetical protein
VASAAFRRSVEPQHASPVDAVVHGRGPGGVNGCRAGQTRPDDASAGSRSEEPLVTLPQPAALQPQLARVENGDVRAPRVSAVASFGFIDRFSDAFDRSAAPLPPRLYGSLNCSRPILPLFFPCFPTFSRYLLALRARAGAPDDIRG